MGQIGHGGAPPPTPSEPGSFILDPIHQRRGLNSQRGQFPQEARAAA